MWSVREQILPHLRHLTHLTSPHPRLHLLATERGCLTLEHRQSSSGQDNHRKLDGELEKRKPVSALRGWDKKYSLQNHLQPP